MYKHNDLLEALAEVGLTNDKPWEEFEFLDSNNDVMLDFVSEDINDVLGTANLGFTWRRKPKGDKAIKGIWCVVNAFCSAVCSKGTKGCDILHKEDKAMTGMIPVEEIEALLKTKTGTHGGGKPFEYYTNLDPHKLNAVVSKYKVKQPKTVTVNGIKCKDDWLEFEGDVLKSEVNIYIESIEREKYYIAVRWNIYTNRKMAIERNIAHFTPEGAAQACKARHGIED